MHTTVAELSLIEPARVLDALASHLSEHAVAVERQGQTATAMLPVGKVSLRLKPAGLGVAVEATSRAKLESAVSFLASHIVEFAAPERPTIAWSGLSPTALLSDFREMTVRAVRDLTPRMRRVTLQGEDLERFATDDHLHVRLFFPVDPSRPCWPRRGPDGLRLADDPATRPIVRKYTIRRMDLNKGMVDIDFVLHSDPGPGSDWAKRAVPGSRVGMAGPGGRSAKAADWSLLVGDETALPAIARILEGLSSGATGNVVIEGDKASAGEPLNLPQAMRLVWCKPGTDGLVNTTRRIAIPKDQSVFCWAGAEFSAIQAIRSHWRDSCGLGKDQQLAVAYWRAGHSAD